MSATGQNFAYLKTLSSPDFPKVSFLKQEHNTVVYPSFNTGEMNVHANVFLASFIPFIFSGMPYHVKLKYHYIYVTYAVVTSTEVQDSNTSCLL